MNSEGKGKKHNILPPHDSSPATYSSSPLLSSLRLSFLSYTSSFFYFLCFPFKVLPLFTKSCSFSYFLYLLIFSLCLFPFCISSTSLLLASSGCERRTKYNKNQSPHQIFTTFPFQHRLRFTVQVPVHVCIYLCSQYACISLTVEIMFTNTGCPRRSGQNFGRAFLMFQKELYNFESL